MNALRTIILADDDPDDRLLVTDALAECAQGVRAMTVNDGQELIDLLQSRSSDAPSLILLDLNMPRKDGRTALREIRDNPALGAIPIVVLSTSSAQEDITAAYDAGANSFIVKPSGFAELMEVISSLTSYWFETVRLP